jgi:very-short-patch-repair endonuclease
MKTNGISDHARKLHSALIQRGASVEIEKWDEHKHIDLSIELAGLYIEIDGDDHYLNSDTILRDLKRDYFSNEDGYDTLHIPNYIIEKNIDGVADALVQVINSRIGK